MIGENIKRYRILKGLSLREFGKLVNMSQTAIMKYEKNILIPDGEKIIEFSQVLNCKVTDLLKDTSKRRNLDLNFRKKEYLSGKKLNVLKETIYELINNYLEVLELNNIKPKIINKYRVSNLNEVEDIALKFRLDNGVNDTIPLINLSNIIENLGISVLIIPNVNNNFKGFDGVSDIVEDVPFICIASDINYYRQRFTLAHELGHLILEIDEGLDCELICNEFASSLLLPRKTMEEEFGNRRISISKREYEIIRKEYGVSIKAIIYRLGKCGIISKNYEKLEYINFNKNLIEEEKNLASQNKELTSKYELLLARLLQQEIITISKYNELMDKWN